MQLRTPIKHNPLKNQSWLLLSKEAKKPIIDAANELLLAEQYANLSLLVGVAPEGYIPSNETTRAAEEKLYEAIFKAIPLTFDMEQGMSYMGHLGMMETLSKVTTCKNGEDVHAFPDVTQRLAQISAIKDAALTYARDNQQSQAR